MNVISAEESQLSRAAACRMLGNNVFLHPRHIDDMELSVICNEMYAKPFHQINILTYSIHVNIMWLGQEGLFNFSEYIFRKTSLVSIIVMYWEIVLFQTKNYNMDSVCGCFYNHIKCDIVRLTAINSFFHLLSVNELSALSPRGDNSHKQIQRKHMAMVTTIDLMLNIFVSIQAEQKSR